MLGAPLLSSTNARNMIRALPFVEWFVEWDLLGSVPCHLVVAVPGGTSSSCPRVDIARLSMPALIP